jgi:hypothetical protein
MDCIILWSTDHIFRNTILHSEIWGSDGFGYEYWIFRDVTPCSQVERHERWTNFFTRLHGISQRRAKAERYRHFGGTLCLHLQGRRWRQMVSSQHIYETTRRQPAFRRNLLIFIFRLEYEVRRLLQNVCILSTRVHGVTFQEIKLFIVTAVISSNSPLPLFSVAYSEDYVTPS